MNCKVSTLGDILFYDGRGSTYFDIQSKVGDLLSRLLG